MALVPELVTAEADPDGDLGRAGRARATGACASRRPWPSIRRTACSSTSPASPTSGAARRRCWTTCCARLARQGHPGPRRHRRLGRARPGRWPGAARTAPSPRRAPRPALLAPLPSPALRLEPETAAQLERLGLRRIGQLAALPRGQLGAPLRARRRSPASTRRWARAEEALSFQPPADALVRAPGLRRADQRAGGPRPRQPRHRRPALRAAGRPKGAGRAALRARLPPAGRPRRAARRRPVPARPRARRHRPAVRPDAGDRRPRLRRSRW